MTKVSLILFIILTLLSCTPSTELTESEKAKIVDEVRLTLKNYYNDIKRSGLTAEFNYLDNSPEFFWVPPGYTEAISYDSVATVLNQNAPGLKSVHNSFDTLRIVPLSKEYAAYTGRLHSVTTDTLGKITTLTLVETGVLVKRKDGWKLLNGQTSVIDH